MTRYTRLFRVSKKKVTAENLIVPFSSRKVSTFVFTGES